MVLGKHILSHFLLKRKRGSNNSAGIDSVNHTYNFTGTTFEDNIDLCQNHVKSTHVKCIALTFNYTSTVVALYQL